MKRKLITLIFLIGLFVIGNAQTNVDDNEMVGFACYEGGSESKPVEFVSRLIDTEKYDSIIDLLDSEYNAERYLAVIVAEKLNELKKIILTREQKDKISKIYNSKGIVSVCSGCTYEDTLTLKSMLEKDNEMRISGNYWLDYKFKTK